MDKYAPKVAKLHSGINVLQSNPFSINHVAYYNNKYYNNNLILFMIFNMLHPPKRYRTLHVFFYEIKYFLN